MRTKTKFIWMCVALAAGCGDDRRARCEVLVTRAPDTCRGDVAASCDVMAALGGTCGGYGNAFLACVEAQDDASICESTGSSCATEANGLGECARANQAICTAFGTCFETDQPISACQVGDYVAYHVGARTFPCAAGDCSRAQAELVAYCGRL